MTAAPTGKSEHRSQSKWILEAAEATFQKDVVERSRQIPIVVDFWAPWCQPCRQLAPTLEKLAEEYAGKFLLVKADTEKLPAIASAFGVQSIPAVYGLRDGELVDYFVGVLPEAQIRAWLDRLLPSAAEQLVSEARKLAASDRTKAEQLLREAIAQGPNLPHAKIALAELLAASGRLDESRALVAELEQRGFLEPEAEKIKAELDLKLATARSGGVAACRAALEKDSDDVEAQLKLAEALAAEGQYEEALETALRVVSADRKGLGEAARKLMVDVFRLLPPDSELTTDYRRKLSTALY